MYLDRLGTCSPTGAGLSELIGSWKIMAMRLPRTSMISSSESLVRSMPSNRIPPLSMRPGGVRPGDALAEVGARIGEDSAYYRMDGTFVSRVVTTDFEWLEWHLWNAQG
jgi:hypothetical protein